MLCSETDFTAKTDAFAAAAEALADGLLVAAEAPSTSEGLGSLPASDGKSVGDLVDDIVGTTGEKVTIGESARFDLPGPGLLFCYVHFNGKIGTLVQIDAENDTAAASDAAKTLAGDLAMHVTAVNPMAVSEDCLDPELVAKEREVAISQVQNKPAEIVDKIVAGKLNKWYQQIVLLKQKFVKDDSQTVSQVVDQAGQQAGGKLTVARFARLQIG